MRELLKAAFKKRNKRGFTLVELVVAIALVAILGMGAFGIMSLIGSIYYDTADASSRQSTTLTITNTIRSAIQSSANVELLADASGVEGALPQGYAYIYTQGTDGKYDIYQRLTPASSGFPMSVAGMVNNKYQYRVSFKKAGHKCIDLKVEIWSIDGSHMIDSRNTTIFIQNVQEVGGVDEGTAIRYSIVGVPAATTP